MTNRSLLNRILRGLCGARLAVKANPGSSAGRSRGTATPTRILVLCVASHHRYRLGRCTRFRTKCTKYYAHQCVPMYIGTTVCTLCRCAHGITRP